MDVNPNHQRSAAFDTPWVVQHGAVWLPDTPGLVPALADWMQDPDAWQSA